MNAEEMPVPTICFPIIRESAIDVAKRALAHLPSKSQHFTITVTPSECKLEIFDLDEAAKR